MNENIGNEKSSGSSSTRSITDAPVRQKPSFWLPILGAGVLATGGYAAWQGSQAQNQADELHRQFSASQKETVALRSQISQSDADLQTALQALRGELSKTQKDTSVQMTRAQMLSSRRADAIAGKIVKRQDEQAAQLTAELGQVKESTSEAATRIDGITTQVGSVKTDVDTAKSDIQQTRSELQRARGDMGQISGLIATNSKEIQMLRDLGDRNIFEFTLTRGASAQKVGDIQIELRKADAKRNRFTLEVLADDKKVEKKDRTVNEPVQFYTASARQPYEVVINQVSKDKVQGYLATPKLVARR
jgi:chromosome segregation ATPase